jgi:hypothetical protein
MYSHVAGLLADWRFGIIYEIPSQRQLLGRQVLKKVYLEMLQPDVHINQGLEFTRRQRTQDAAMQITIERADFLATEFPDSNVTIYDRWDTPINPGYLRSHPPGL